MGQSILESYSRVLESLSFTIISRIDDVLYADDLVKRSIVPQLSVAKEVSVSRRLGFSSRRTRSHGSESKRFTNLNTTFATPIISPSFSPSLSPLKATPNSPHNVATGLIIASSLGKALSEYMCRHIPEGEALSENEISRKLQVDGVKSWAHARHLEKSNVHHSLGRD